MQNSDNNNDDCNKIQKKNKFFRIDDDMHLKTVKMINILIAIN